MTAQPETDLTHLDFAPKCDGRNCDNTAALALITRCCNTVHFGCLRCREHNRQQLAAPGLKACHICKKPVATWNDYIYEEKL